MLCHGVQLIPFHELSPATHPPFAKPTHPQNTGALPDQLEFSRDCRTILVSNEGEPETYSPPSLANDPEGSVSVINLRFCNERDDGYAYAYDDSASTAGLKR